MLEVIMKKINKEEKIVVSSRDVADTFEKEHKHVLEDIRKICESLSTAEISALFYEDSYTASNGKKNPMYLMNRDGFTLLVMGYTGEKAMKFKLAYINQFNHMEKLLKEKFVERQKGITVRHIVTDMIKQSQENERMHGHAYSIYTDMIYKALFGKSARQFREEFGIGKTDSLRDFFTPEELKAIQSKEMLVTSLIDCGWGYEKIKDFLQENIVQTIS